MPTKTTTKTTTSPTSTSPTSARRRPSAPAPEAVQTAQAGPGVGMPVPHALSDDELSLVTAGGGAGVTSTTTEPAGPPPMLTPPGAVALPAASAAAAAITGQRVLATWAEQSNRNAWAYFQTAGWKLLSPLTDTGSTTMTLLAAHARATGSAPYADENPAGTIDVLYVW